jgi:hypothetical protein
LATYQTSLQFESRETKKAKIQAFFEMNLGERFSSQTLHVKFGSSVRTRISEINRDPASPVRIKNAFFYDRFLKAEISSYWSEAK